MELSTSTQPNRAWHRQVKLDGMELLLFFEDSNLDDYRYRQCPPRNSLSIELALRSDMHNTHHQIS